MRKLSDEKLLEIYKTAEDSQKRKAFDCLYSRYSDLVTEYFYFALYRDIEKAKDFVHDLFIKILDSPEKFNTSKKFKPWMFQVASNMCKNEFRRQQVSNKYHEYIKVTTPNEETLKPKEKQLNRSIKRLSPEHRSLIVLRFKIKLSIKEIANILECPEGTVKSRLFYATKELAKLYKA